MDQQLPDLIGEEIINERPMWRWDDGSLTPVIRGGAEGDPDDDPDEDPDEDPEGDDPEEDPDEDDEDEDEDPDEEGDADEDAEYEAAIEDIVTRVTEKLGDKFDSIADRRINKLVKRLDRKADRGDDDDEPKGSRSRRKPSDNESAFSTREARLSGMEIVRDELGRMSTEDREIVRDLLGVEIAKLRDSGDDEDTVGEAAGKAVVTRMKSLRTRTSRSTKDALRKKGALKEPSKQSAGSGKDRKSSKSRMAAGAARAAQIRPTTNQNKE